MSLDVSTGATPSGWKITIIAIDLSVCPHCGGTLRVIAGGRLRTSPIRM